jgi:hypothetical protein
MIALALVAALAGQSLVDERSALIAQAVDQIAAPYGELTYALGLCAKTYPLGASDPYVVQAKRDVAELGLREITFALARIEAVSYAEGVEDAKSSRTTVRGCSNVIAEAGEQVSQNVNGLRGLMHQLAE